MIAVGATKEKPKRVRKWWAKYKHHTPYSFSLFPLVTRSTRKTYIRATSSSSSYSSSSSPSYSSSSMSRKDVRGPRLPPPLPLARAGRVRPDKVAAGARRGRAEKGTGRRKARVTMLVRVTLRANRPRTETPENEEDKERRGMMLTGGVATARARGCLWVEYLRSFAACGGLGLMVMILGWGRRLSRAVLSECNAHTPAPGPDSRNRIPMTLSLWGRDGGIVSVSVLVVGSECCGCISYTRRLRSRSSLSFRD